MTLFIINLDAQTERRRTMQAQLDHYGLHATFMPAVNGKALSLEALRTVAHDYDNSGLSAGEVGCALSHLAIYQKMVDEGIASALILEDDAILTPDTAKIVDALQPHINTPKACAYLLTTPSIYVGDHPRPILNTHQAYPLLDAWRAHGYVLNLAAAQSLLTALQPIRIEADRWGYFIQMGYLDAYCIMPPVIHDNDADRSHSSLEADRGPLCQKRAAYYETHIKKNRPLRVRLKRALWRLFKRPFITLVRLDKP